MNMEIIMAGFGGQGVMLMGQLVTYAGMIENRHVSWYPSYGPEMRGGTANCSVIVSDDPVGSPIIHDPNVVVAMNLPSLDKFEPTLQAGGILIINSSLIERKASRTDITTYYVPANTLAIELGNPKVANMLILGALAAATKVVSPDTLLLAFSKKMGNKLAEKPQLLSINQTAIQRGANCIAEQ